MEKCHAHDSVTRKYKGKEFSMFLLLLLIHLLLLLLLIPMKLLQLLLCRCCRQICKVRASTVNDERNVIFIYIFHFILKNIRTHIFTRMRCHTEIKSTIYYYI